MTEVKTMSTGKKIALGIVLFFVALLFVLIIVVPRLMDVDRYRPRVVAHIREETGKPAEIGRLALTLFPTVSIRVDDFQLGNPAGFPQGAFLKVRRINAELDARALWNREILIKSLELNQPIVRLLSDVRGRWNFENPSKARASRSASRGDRPMFSLDVISKVSLVGGQLTAASVLASGAAGPAYFEAHDVSSELKQVDVNAFTASAAVGPGPRPTHWQVLQAAWGDSLAYAASPAPRSAAEGLLKAQSLRFGALSVTGVKCKLRLFPKQVLFNDSSFELYGGHAVGNLVFDFAGQNLRYSADARLSGVDVARLLAAFPDARGKMTGQMDGRVKLSGEVRHSPDPLAGMRGVGQLSVRNGQLPTLQLNKNLMLLARLSNLGPASGDPSSFSSISADLNIANERLTSNKIVIVGNGVDVDGSGGLSLAGAGNLGYEGVARLAAGQSPVTNALVGFLGATLSNGKLSFPFTLAGTLANPKFILKSTAGGGRLGGLQNVMGGQPGPPGAQAPGQTQQPADVVQGIVGLFKKKQSPQPPQPGKP